MDDMQTAALCIAAATALACWWIVDWAREDPASAKPWSWGDPPRREAVSCEAIVTQIVGAGFLLGCLVFAARAAGFE